MPILKFIGTLVVGLIMSNLLAASGFILFVFLTSPEILFAVKAFGVAAYIFIAYTVGDIIFAYWKYRYQELQRTKP